MFYFVRLGQAGNVFKTKDPPPPLSPPLLHQLSNYGITTKKGDLNGFAADLP